MIKRSVAFMALVVWMIGCGNTVDLADSTKGPSSGESKGIGSMSTIEDIGGYLQEKSWRSVTLDLESYLYDKKGTTSSYEVEMLFDKKSVSVLADCYYIDARYRISDNEITFSKVSSPRPALDLPSCKEVVGAESAVSNFLLYSYEVIPKNQKEVLFEGTDIETSVTLRR